MKDEGMLGICDKAQEKLAKRLEKNRLDSIISENRYKVISFGICPDCGGPLNKRSIGLFTKKRIIDGHTWELVCPEHGIMRSSSDASDF